MQSLPRISIVTPSYNHADFIEKTIRSVLCQGYRNLEYIVMDGGSTDKTLEVVEPYRNQITHFISEKDEGQADAIARGFERSTGDIMAYLNSDDMLGPQTLEFVGCFFSENPHVDAIYSHRLAVDVADRVIWYWILPRHSSYMMSRWDLIPQETCFWRRSLWEKAGNVDISFKFAMDYDLFVRFMKHGRFKRVNRFLGAFRQHNSGKTTQLMNTIGVQEIQRVWRDNGFKSRFFSRLIAHRFSKRVSWRGLAFARRCRVLPGNHPGVGYSYDRVWGGQLFQSARLSKERHSEILSRQAELSPLVE